jgi:hypothetical protein
MRRKILKTRQEPLETRIETETILEFASWLHNSRKTRVADIVVRLRRALDEAYRRGYADGLCSRDELEADQFAATQGRVNTHEA